VGGAGRTLTTTILTDVCDDAPKLWGTVEIHVPISPTIEMLTMVRVLEATLTRFGQLGRRA
jgi:hypothetical protein